MSRLIRNTTSAERARGCVFSETFENHQAVVENGGTIAGNPSIDFGAVFDGVNDYIVYNKKYDFLGNFSVSFWIKTAVTSSLVIFSDTGGSTLNGVMGYVNADGTITCRYGNGSAQANISSVAAYNDDELHLVTFSVTRAGTAYLWIDGTEATSGTTGAGNTGAVTNMAIGAHASGAAKVAATIKDFRMFTEALTKEEHLDLYDNSTYDYMNDCVLHLPMGMEQHDETNTRTLDVSGNGNHADFGSGVVVAGFKEEKHGYVFDGVSDTLDVPSSPMNFGTGDFSFQTMVRLTADGYRGIFGKFNTASAGEYGYILRCGSMVPRFFIGGVSVVLAAVNFYMTLGKVHTVGIVRRGDIVEMFIDGELNASVAGQAAKDATSSTVLKIGAQGAAVYWQGGIMSVQAFDKALTPTQMSDSHLRLLKQINNI